MNLKDAIALWRRELSDVKSTLHPDGKRFSDAEFIAWTNQARAMVYNYRPQWYQKTVVLKLSPGSLQNTCDCNKFYAIDGITDALGNIIAPLTKANSKAGDFFPKSVCAPCVELTATLIGASGGATQSVPAVAPIIPQTYATDVNIPGRFTITPPVSATGDYYVRAVCAQPPAACCTLEPTDPNDKTCCMSYEEFPVVQWYVKAMAHGTLKDSTNSNNLQQQFMKMFYEMLGIQKKADLEYQQKTKAA